MKGGRGPQGLKGSPKTVPGQPVSVAEPPVGSGQMEVCDSDRLGATHSEKGNNSPSLSR